MRLASYDFTGEQATNDEQSKAGQMSDRGGGPQLESAEGGEHKSRSGDRMPSYPVFEPRPPQRKSPDLLSSPT